jgi:hypothetical protein
MDEIQVPLLTLVRFKVVSAVTAVTVTLTVPPAPIVAVPDACIIYSISCRSVMVKWHQHQNKSDY